MNDQTNKSDVSKSQSKDTQITYTSNTEKGDFISDAAGMISSRCTIDNALEHIEESEYEHVYLSASQMSIANLLNNDGGFF